MQSHYMHRGLCLLMEQEVRSKYTAINTKLKRSVEQPNSLVFEQHCPFYISLIRAHHSVFLFFILLIGIQ